jgi:hypothetical protein
VPVCLNFLFLTQVHLGILSRSRTGRQRTPCHGKDSPRLRVLQSQSHRAAIAIDAGRRTASTLGNDMVRTRH